MLSKRPPRNPDRSKPTASVSVPWYTYDRLNVLAEHENTSLANVIKGLLDFYQASLPQPSTEHEGN